MTSNGEEAKRLEAIRISVLHKYEILDSFPEASFDHVVQLTASLLQVPIALMTLVDTDRIWFKSSVGLKIPQINREPGLDASAILSAETYVVEDARKDPRTISHPMVRSEFGLQFYAAAPLTVDGGFHIGTICVMNHEPHIMSPSEKNILEKMAGILVDQLELRLQARQANTRQQLMLNMVAHELKNPLTIIPAYIDLIKKEAADRELIISMCSHIRKASDRMNDLINEVLETAKLNAQHMPLKKTIFDIASVISRVSSINLVLANAKKQKMHLDIADNLMVEADEEKMVEVLNNLINNAIKYSPADTAISLKLKAENKTAVFEICDNGPGLTDKDFDQLFMPFTRLTARPTAGENSTGIGLFIVKMLVEAQGGKVWAHNIDGAGACFTVELLVSSEN